MFLLKQDTFELYCNDELQYEIVDKYLVNGVRTSKKKIQYMSNSVYVLLTNDWLLYLSYDIIKYRKQ